LLAGATTAVARSSTGFRSAHASLQGINSRLALQARKQLTEKQARGATQQEQSHNTTTGKNDSDNIELYQSDYV